MGAASTGGTAAQGTPPAQLAMEERNLARARADGAARLSRAHAQRALGADPAQLADALAGYADDAHVQHALSGLREDQAAATWSVLTDGRRVTLILDATTANAAMFALAAYADERDAHLREVEQVGRSLPEGSYGRLSDRHLPARIDSAIQTVSSTGNTGALLIHGSLSAIDVSGSPRLWGTARSNPT